MNYALRASLRKIRDALTDATRVLPWLGFGKPAEPPTEPIHRSGSESERPEDVTELHEQQHVQPGKRVEIDHPNK